MTAAPSDLVPAPGPVLPNSLQPQVSSYSAYGLSIRSELPLPEFTLLPDGSSIDVSITFGGGDEWIPAVREQTSFWQVGMHEARLWFQGVAGFHILNGRQITVSPEPGIDNSLLRMYVEGMMMATLLYQRGYFVLHASVVRIDDTSVALLGNVGAGKSSTAAALHARGHAVVTDDNAAIAFTAEAPLVTPAFPFVKVFPAIAAALGCAESSLSRMHPSQPKFVSPVVNGFPQAPVPLSRIYILCRDTEEMVAPLNAIETTLELVRNSVPTRWKLPGGANHLQQCATLAARVPAFRLRTFHQLTELPVLAETIERHHRGAFLV